MVDNNIRKRRQMGREHEIRTASFGATSHANLVVEHREVQRQPQTDRVRHNQVRRRDLHGLVVRPVRVVRRAALTLALREFGDVAVVVALHLEVEDLRGRWPPGSA